MDFVFVAGQSNAVGNPGATSPPGGLPLAAVRFFRHVAGTNKNIQDITHQDLQISVATDTYNSVELQLGVDLNTVGRTVRIAKAAVNGTAMSTWVPSAGTHYYKLKNAILGARPQSLVTMNCHLVWLQGEYEATDATETLALQWASDFTTMHSALVAFVGRPIRKHICRTMLTLPGGTWINTVRAQQASVADSLIDTDDLTTVDGTHYDAASLNTLGSRCAASIIASP
jgi:hypothetical protein